MPPPAKASDLLRFRLSPAEFEAYVAQSRKPRLGYCEQSGADIDQSKLQAVVVRGFDPDAVVASVAGSGPWTGPGPVKRPGPKWAGPDQDHRIIGPVLGPGPGPLPGDSSKGLLRTGLDRSLYTLKDRSQTSLSALFLQDSNPI